MVSEFLPLSSFFAQGRPIPKNPHYYEFIMAILDISRAATTSPKVRSSIEKFPILRPGVIYRCQRRGSCILKLKLQAFNSTS